MKLKNTLMAPYDNIDRKALIQKYLNAETSVEEERLLAESFADNPPKDEEEKRVAYTFLRDMLTKEALSSPNAPVNDGSINRDTFKIRKDVLEDKYEEFDRRQVNSRVQELTNGKIPELWADYLKIQQEAEEIQKSEGQKDREFFWKLIQNGTVKKDFPAALEKVFEEELTEYERGVIDDRMVSEHLQNRFRLYLEEAK